MANTIVITDKTIEISAIDSDYTMTESKPIWSVVLYSGTAADEVFIIEDDGISSSDPLKCHLQKSADEPREHYFFGQKMRLGFVFADGTFGATAKVIFNIGERGY
jgi:hypothetical protein